MVPLEVSRPATILWCVKLIGFYLKLHVELTQTRDEPCLLGRTKTARIGRDALQSFWVMGDSRIDSTVMALYVDTLE